VISNPNNPTIREIRRLRKRRERDRRRQMIVEGHRALAVALKRKAGVSRVLHTRAGADKRADLLQDAKAQGAAVLEVSPAVMASLTSVTTAPDVIGVAALPCCTLDEAVARLGFGAVLAGVRDPATAGSILQSCAAAGGTVAIATTGTADVFAPKPVRAAAGAHFALSIAPDVTPEECAAALRAAGVRIVLADAEAPASTASLDRRVAILVGEDGPLPPALSSVSEERAGVGAAHADLRPSIAGLAAVVLFDAIRRTRDAGDG